MATGGLYGSTSTGTVAPQSGSESVGLYGNNTVFGGSYFEWFIFQEAASQPATPTSGSWSFSTNSGTAPTGWTSVPPAAPTTKVWVSIALVNSKTTATLTWSTPGLFSGTNGTVTNVSALTLGTTGTDVSSTVANPTTTPVITLNLPTASATNRGALSAADWTTFNNKGTVTSVSGTTGRVTSTGGTTPVIDLASGVATPGTTGSSALVPVVTVDTYGRVTSITTAANPQGTVTSVTGTAPVVSSGGATPAISMAAATASVSGYLTSTDWNTFNSKGSGSVTSVAATVPSFLSITGSPITTSGTLAISYSGTALPVANGGTGVTASSGANSVVLRDANGNITTNCLFEGFASQAASGTTIVLTAASVQNYQITGSGGQIIKLPNATTLPNGALFTFNNNQSSGTITVQNNSSTTIATINSGGYVTVVLLDNTTAAGTWDRHDSTPSNVSWSTNTLDYPGSITSATWNGVAVAVNRGGTGLSTGTSGGVPYFSSTSTIASSAALAANALVIGGGAGVAPSTTTTGTGVVTALGVNTGSAGAFVVNGGALGTPSSGTLTNATGLPLTTGVTGALPIANGGTGLTTTPANGALDIGNGTGFTRTTLTAGTGISVTNASGSITIAASGGSGTVTSVAATVPSFLSVSGSPITNSGTLAISYSGTALPVANGGTGVTTSTGTTNVVLSNSPTIVTPTISTITSAASTALTLQSNNGTTAVTVDTSQNVGIGTTVIRTKFASVSGTDNTSAGSDPSGYAGSFIGTSGAANQSTLSVESNDTVAANTGGSIGLGGRYSSTSWAQWAKIAALKDNATVGDYGGSLAFYTRANGGSNTEKMRIDSSGNVLVATTNSTPGNGSGANVSGFAVNTNGTTWASRSGFAALSLNRVDTTGDVLRAASAGNQVGGISVTSVATVFNTTSDYRLKDNIAPMTNALATIAALKPCTYTWKSAPDEVGEGFIAHELAEVCPSAVTGTKDAVDADGNPKYQGIDTSFLVATLTAAIQEQQALIASLTARIAALEIK